MPELPEVEVVCRGLSKTTSSKHSILKIKKGKHSLRFPWPKSLLNKIQGEHIVGLSRRAKYILFELENYYLISHLGMTGTWRWDDKQKIHDHLEINFSNGKTLKYNDPRRFGYIDLVAKHNISNYKRFAHLGPEPLNTEFDSEYLVTKCKGKAGAIKSLIMDQKVVVGVGNIYASEALFLAGIRPTQAAGKVKKAKLILLTKFIKQVLSKAIAAGGSSIKNFKNANSASGYFQMQFKVYGRDGESCYVCNSKVQSVVIAGRNSFYCRKCQKA